MCEADRTAFAYYIMSISENDAELAQVMAINADLYLHICRVRDRVRGCRVRELDARVYR